MVALRNDAPILGGGGVSPGKRRRILLAPPEDRLLPESISCSLGLDAKKPNSL
jgi:hypothetical protein